MLLDCFVRQSTPPNHQHLWDFFNYSRGTRYYHSMRSHAHENRFWLCEQRVRLERMAKPDGVDQRRACVPRGNVEWRVRKSVLWCTHHSMPHLLTIVIVGTPDCVTHLAEEIPNPGVNVPKAIAAQIGVGILTGFLYLVAIFYATNNLSDVLSSTSTFPLAAVYNQATNSQGGALGLLILVFIPISFTCIGVHITSGRVLWSLARDKATPFSHTLGRVSQTWKNPFNAHLTGGIIVTILGCIYIGSSTAFNAFVGSFVVLSSASYVAAILPHILNRRQYIKPGPFYMKGILGYIVSGISSAYILAFIVIYCFPFSMPVSALSMNYASLITGGLTVFVTLWWLWIRTHGYVGPRALMEDMKRISMQESSHSEQTELGAYSSGMSTAGERYEVPGDAYEVPRRI